MFFITAGISSSFLKHPDVSFQGLEKNGGKASSASVAWLGILTDLCGFSSFFFGSLEAISHESYSDRARFLVNTFCSYAPLCSICSMYGIYLPT